MMTRGKFSASPYAAAAGKKKSARADEERDDSDDDEVVSDDDEYEESSSDDSPSSESDDEDDEDDESSSEDPSSSSGSDDDDEVEHLKTKGSAAPPAKKAKLGNGAAAAASAKPTISTPTSTAKAAKPAAAASAKPSISTPTSTSKAAAGKPAAAAAVSMPAAAAAAASTPSASSTPAAAAASSSSSSSSSSAGASQQAGQRVVLLATVNEKYVMGMLSGHQTTVKISCDSLKVQTANLLPGKLYLAAMSESRNFKKNEMEYKMLAQPTGPIVTPGFIAPEVTTAMLNVGSLTAEKKHRVYNIMGVVHSEPEELESKDNVAYKSVLFVVRTGSGADDVMELKLSLWSSKPGERQCGNNPYEVISQLKVGTAALLVSVLVRDNGRGAPALSAGQYQSIVTLKADAKGTPTTQFKDLEDWYADRVMGNVAAGFTLPPDMEFEMLDAVEGAPQSGSAASAASAAAASGEEQQKKHDRHKQ